MSNVLDKSFIHRSYPKLAYGSIYEYPSLSGTMAETVSIDYLQLYKSDTCNVKQTKQEGKTTRKVFV